jgi:hypothetical protein
MFVTLLGQGGVLKITADVYCPCSWWSTAYAFQQQWGSVASLCLKIPQKFGMMQCVCGCCIDICSWPCQNLLVDVSWSIYRLWYARNPKDPFLVKPIWQWLLLWCIDWLVKGKQTNRHQTHSGTHPLCVQSGQIMCSIEMFKHLNRNFQVEIKHTVGLFVVLCVLV